MYPAHAPAPEVTHQILPTGMNHFAESIGNCQYFQTIFHFLIKQHRDRRFFEKSFLSLIHRIGFFRHLYRCIASVTENGNPIFPFHLGVIQCPIHFLIQFLIIMRFRSGFRNSSADSEGIIQSKVGLFNIPFQIFCCLPGFPGAVIGEYTHKFISAPATDERLSIQTGVHPARQAFQHLIPFDVAIGIIYSFKMVNIKKEKRGNIALPGINHCIFQLKLNSRTVQQVRHPVMLCI